LLYDVVVAIAADKSLKFIKWEISPDSNPEDSPDEDDCSDCSLEETIKYIENDSEYYVGEHAPGLYKAELYIGNEETDLDILEPLYQC